MSTAISTKSGILPVHLSGDFHELSPQFLFPIVEDFVIASYAPLSGEMERSWEFEFLLLLHGILLLLCFR